MASIYRSNKEAAVRSNRVAVFAYWRTKEPKFQFQKKFILLAIERVKDAILLTSINIFGDIVIVINTVVSGAHLRDPLYYTCIQSKFRLSWRLEVNEKRAWGRVFLSFPFSCRCIFLIPVKIPFRGEKRIDFASHSLLLCYIFVYVAVTQIFAQFWLVNTNDFSDWLKLTTCDATKMPEIGVPSLVSHKIQKCHSHWVMLIMK